LSSGLNKLSGAIKPLSKAVSAYLHHQSDAVKSVNLPIQLSQTSILDKFIITFSISLLVIDLFSSYATGLVDISTIIHNFANLLAAVTSGV
jgi:hypothetical protein